MIKLNLGCGGKIQEGWINVDYALGARVAKIPFFSTINRRLKIFNLNWDKKIFIHNLVKPFPWADNSVDYIYTSHLLEHFSREDGYQFLKECHRVLREKAIIRIVVPDLHYIVTEYLNRNINSTYFLDELNVLYKNRISHLIYYPHKCMYNRETLASILNEIGFCVESKNAYESRLPDIEEIELEERTKNAVIIEGEKIPILVQVAEK